MSQNDPLSALETGSLCFSSETRRVRLDGELPEVEQTYLTLSGTPEGFRWLARQLTRMAVSAEERHIANSVIVSPQDFPGQPVKMEGWDSLDLRCAEQASE